MVHLTPFLACKTEPHPCKFDLDHINTRASKNVSAQNLGGGTFHGRLNVPGAGLLGSELWSLECTLIQVKTVLLARRGRNIYAINTRTARGTNQCQVLKGSLSTGSRGSDPLN